MRGYLEIARNGFLQSIAFRWHVFFTAIGNIFYIIMIYFLWQAVYAHSSGSLHDETFQDTFLQLALASSLFVLFQNFLEWHISNDVLDGNIIIRLLKPYDYQLMHIAQSFGSMIFNLITTVIPTGVIILVVFGSAKHFSVVQMAIFTISVFLAFLISVIIDYMVGTISFYTESIWGISVAKESVVLFFSGAMIPLSFFPSSFQTLIRALPFQAIYAIPLSILLSFKTAMISLQGIVLQLFWLSALVALSRFFFARAVKVVTVNGG